MTARERIPAAADRSRQYSLTREDAVDLGGMSSMPVDLREEVIIGLMKRRGQKAVIRMFANFMGLANSVVANMRDAIEVYAIVEGDMHPHSAEQLNLPDIFGACNGAGLTDRIDQSKLCDTCAFRLGTIANQCAPTTCDADYCAHPGERPFLCHEHEEGEEPSKACAGFAQLRARRKPLAEAE